MSRKQVACDLACRGHDSPHGPRMTAVPPHVYLPLGRRSKEKSKMQSTPCLSSSFLSYSLALPEFCSHLCLERPRREDKVPAFQLLCLRESKGSLDVWLYLPDPRDSSDFQLLVLQVLRMMVGVNISDEQLGSIADRTIQEADQDGDSAISFTEFVKVS